MHISHCTEQITLYYLYGYSWTQNLRIWKCSWAWWKNRGKRSPRKNTKSKYLRGQVLEFFVLGIKTRAGTTSDSKTMEDRGGGKELTNPNPAPTPLNIISNLASMNKQDRKGKGNDTKGNGSIQTDTAGC